MPYQNDSELVQIAGYVGKAPQRFESAKGPFVTFSLAVTKSYGDDGTRWIRVAVNNDELQEFAMRNIHKGTPVVAEGFRYDSEWQGETQYNMNAFRLGIVDWFVRGTKQQPRPAVDEDL